MITERIHFKEKKDEMLLRIARHLILNASF